MGSIIECVKRIYKIQTPDGIEIKIESEERSISGVMTAKLLQEDKEICFFFEKCKILGIENIRKEEKQEKRDRSKKKKREDTITKKDLEIQVIETSEIQETKEGEEPLRGHLGPFERLNMMLKIEGDFTRVDYQNLLEDSGYRISNFMGHGDMEDALLLRRIERTGEKIGKGLRKYKVIDVTPVNDDMYREMRRQYRNKIKY